MTNPPILFKLKFTDVERFIQGHLLEDSYARYEANSNNKKHKGITEFL